MQHFLNIINCHIYHLILLELVYINTIRVDMSVTEDAHLQKTVHKHSFIFITGSLF